MRVRSTIPREKLVMAQTPQVFAYNLLVRAFASARDDGFTGTDESSLVERLDVEVSVVPVLLGEGVPLLPAPTKRITLKLTGHRLYATTGIMSLEYAVQYGRTPKRRK